MSPAKQARPKVGRTPAYLVALKSSKSRLAHTEFSVLPGLCWHSHTQLCWWMVTMSKATSLLKKTVTGPER